MYEDYTHDELLTTMLSEISDDVIKTEGSLVYNSLSALAYELEKIYIQMDYIIDQANASTADYDSLVLIASERGITPNAATYAVVSITADAELPTGTRFSLKGYNYAVDEALDEENYIYQATCEEAGSGANGLLGTLTAIDYVEGLTTATLTEVLVAGEDAETQDELLERYLESFTSLSFAGNVAAYKSEILSIDGVGGVKVYPVWDGAGTVKCVIQSSDYGAASDYLVSSVQEAADPTDYTGEGYGFAPIDHTVTIESVEEVTVDVATTITYSSGYDWDTIGEEITTAISNYLLGIATEWGDGDENTTPVVYISRLESAVLDVTGVTDISGTTLNSASANLTLTSTQIPVIGEVTVS